VGARSSKIYEPVRGGSQNGGEGRYLEENGRKGLLRETKKTGNPKIGNGGKEGGVYKSDKAEPKIERGRALIREEIGEWRKGQKITRQVIWAWGVEKEIRVAWIQGGGG